MAAKHHDQKPPPTYTSCPPTPDKKGNRHFKHRLEVFERQLNHKDKSTDPCLDRKPTLAEKDTIKKLTPSPLGQSHLDGPEGLLALYEEAPFHGGGGAGDISGDLFDQYDNSRANLIRLCKIAYEKGRKDGVAEDRKKVKEEGYRQGFKDGQKLGCEDGWKEGYREGYDEGYMKGRDYGDKKIEKEINETIAELTKNPNALLMSCEYTVGAGEHTSQLAGIS
ncbi:hypothetical protein Dda_3681 [Drechslerella dactyloides]|uniref:Essential protein Yae1 N-terminal domain-containing protein n=1 Tax=Drechslerella dactyloides TaxID=74499 RepID=A0AAD6J2Q5_DREDA|nr:hypothetical protein Dda_3681 [Drechslerella dactyloides]